MGHKLKTPALRERSGEVVTIWQGALGGTRGTRIVAIDVDDDDAPCLIKIIRMTQTGTGVYWTDAENQEPLSWLEKHLALALAEETGTLMLPVFATPQAGEVRALELRRYREDLQRYQDANSIPDNETEG
jgi:hypothetical protein